mmetsp:Transcript_22072/g.41374  ORF Transcript_22072/g.41374 Transcript_22072/m.41374 type:complete len:264 (-) Transcript_22072:671-1462(-)
MMHGSNAVAAVPCIGTGHWRWDRIACCSCMLPALFGTAVRLRAIEVVHLPPEEKPGAKVARVSHSVSSLRGVNRAVDGSERVVVADEFWIVVQEVTEVARPWELPLEVVVLPTFVPTALTKRLNGTALHSPVHLVVARFYQRSDFDLVLHSEFIPLLQSVGDLPLHFVIDQNATSLNPLPCLANVLCPPKPNQDNLNGVLEPLVKEVNAVQTLSVFLTRTSHFLVTHLVVHAEGLRVSEEPNSLVTQLVACRSPRVVKLPGLL